MILCITDVVSYKSIICMILVYDTLHYDQPKYNSALYMAFFAYVEEREARKKWRSGLSCKSQPLLHGGALGEAPV